MALIIIAFYTYCRQAKDDKIKQFGKTSKQKGHDSFKLLNNLKKGDGQRIKSLIQKCLEKPLNEILEMVIPGEENMLERSKIIANFVKQAKKITPSGFDSDQNEMIEVLVNTITESKEELKKELEKVKSDFTPEKKEAAKNAANTATLIKQLRKAVESNDFKTIAEIFKTNPDLVNSPKIIDFSGGSLLNWAVFQGNSELIDLLLQQPNIDPNIQMDNGTGMTPLHIAFDDENYDIAEELLRKCPNINPTIQDSNGNTPLHEAASEGFTEIVKLMLQRPNIDFNIKNLNGNTPLSVATSRNYEKIVRLLLDRGANPNIQDENGNTPLHLAVNEGFTEIVKLLLDHDAMPNIKNKYGYKPLDYVGNNKRIIKLFLDRITDFNAIPLYVAVNEELTSSIIEKLLDNGVDPNEKDHKGNTPLHLAAFHGDMEIVRLLLDRGAKPNTKNNAGQTPLHQAVLENNRGIVQLLLDHNADPNVKDNNCVTPLHYAVLRNNIAIVGLLLQHKKIDIDAKNNDGVTPLHIAADRNRREIIELLLTHGADPTIRDNRGRTYQDLLPRQPRRL